MRKRSDKLLLITCWLLLLLQTTVYSSRELRGPPDDEDFSNGGSGDGPDEIEETISKQYFPDNYSNVSTATNDRRNEIFKPRWSSIPDTHYTPPPPPLKPVTSSYHTHYSQSLSSSVVSSLSSSSSSSSRSWALTSTVAPISNTNTDFRWSSHYENRPIISNSYLGDRDRIAIRVYPTSQIIYTTQEVVIRCRDESYRRLPVMWSRSDGKPLSLEAIDNSGRLVIPNIKLSDAGEYKCTPTDPAYRYLHSNLSTVIVYPIETLHSAHSAHSAHSVPSYQPLTCRDGLQVCPGTKNCIPKSYFCDGEPDCTGAKDEENCESCKLYQFKCKNGQCIDRNARCDSISDCRDGSDEVDCNERGNALPLQLSIVPPYMDVERGAFVQFACASSDPNARLAWVFEQGQLPSTATVLGGTLTIRNAQEFDQGTYICMGTDVYGTKAEAQARLTVRRPQSMVYANIVPRYIEVQEGGNVMLSCSSSSAGSVYGWKFNRGDLPPGAEAINNQLRIYQANQRHSGQYQCLVKTSTGGIGEANALVTINSVMSERRPSMIVQPSHGEAPIGGTFRFLCNATDPRPNQIIWTYKRGVLPYGVTQSREQLTINPVSEANYGEYICIVTNSFGRNQQTVELHRPGRIGHDDSNQPAPPSSMGPNIEITPVAGLSLPVGDYARFECQSNDVEPDEIRWSSSSGSLPAGVSIDKGLLTIPSITEAHYGIYLCEARNSYAATRKSVELRRPSLSPNISPPYRPATGPTDATIEPQQQTIVQGNSGILRCLVTGPPNVLLVWSKVNGVLTERHRIDGEIMRIENAVITDRGLYVCKVESPPGTVIAQGSAIVEIEPREVPQGDIYPDIKQTIPIGGSALFQCRLTAGIPEPKIHWTRADNLPLTPNTEIVDGGVIRFLRVTGSEEGIYKCTAENIAGRVEYEATLRIERTELNPQIPPTSPIRPPYSPRPSDPLIQPPRYRPSSPDGTSITIAQRSPLVIKSGEPLVLDCYIPDEVDTRLTWKSVKEDRYITAPSVRRAVFQKYDTTPADSGEYRCTAINSAISLEERIQVVVQPGESDYKPHYPPQPTTSHESIRNVTLTVGGSTQIKCHASGPNIVSHVMTWTRESGPLPSNSQQRDGTLWINNITENDTGTYVCTGRGHGGQVVAIQRVLLNVQSQVTLHLDPITQVVAPGQRVQINCLATGPDTKDLRVDWNREGAAMSPNTRVIGNLLYFMEISPSDTGSYICRAGTQAGEVRAVAVAYVQVGATSSSHPHQPHHYPTEPIRPAPQYPHNYETRPPTGKREIVDLSTTKTLSCDFSRIPGHIIRWEFNNNKILPTNAVAYGNNIVISNVEKTNEGRYICNAHLPGSERPIDRDFIDLIVRDPQTCSPYEFRCYDGTCIERERRCDGRPDCYDQSDEQYCPDSRQPYPRQPDTRTYPSLNQAAYPDPRYPQQPIKVDVKIESSKLMVTIGDDLELRCRADGPDYQYEWFKDAQPVKTENVEINHNVLRIKNIRSENGGVYTCRARSRYSYGTDDYVVMIQRVSPQDDIRIVEADLGSTIALDCPRVFADGAYTWSRPGELLPKDAESLSHRLILRNVKPNFGGQYECIVKGSEGTAVSYVTLVVKKVIPRFRREMYSHIKLPSIPESEKSFDIEIAVKPEYSEGLIMYNSGPLDPSSNHQDFVSLSLTRGTLEYRMKIGSSDLIKISSSKPLTLNEWSKIVIQKDGHNVILVINDLAEAPVKLTGDNLNLKLGEPLYIGGVSRSTQLHPEAGLVDGFIGCMSTLKVRGRSILMVDEGEIFGVTSCSTCSSDVCSGHGACHEDANVTNGFRCICHPGFSGRNCSANVDACKEGSCGVGKCVNQPEGGFECYCPYGRIGLRCEREITIRQPSFGGKSFVSIPTNLLKSIPETSSEPNVEPPKSPKEPQLNLKLQVKPKPDQEGLLIYSGQDESGKKDFAAVTIKNKAIEFAFDMGSGPAFIRSAPLESFDEFVTFHVTTDQNNGILTVNGKEYKETAPGPTKGLQLDNQMFIGGYDAQKIKLPRSLNVSHGFEGCIAHIEVNGVPVDFASAVIDSANVDDCGPHDECSQAGQQCQNGGTCQTDSCLCPVEFTGHRCETPISGANVTATTIINTTVEGTTQQIPVSEGPVSE